MLAAGTDADAASWWDEATPLTLASRQGHESVITALLAAGADPEHRTRRGANALLLAAQGGHLGAVRRLLACGAAIDTVLPRSGVTPLVAASIAGHFSVVRALLGAGADPAAATREGGTALGYATHPTVIRILSEAVANTSTRLGRRHDLL